MEDAKIIALFWERNEQAVKETDTAYGGRLYSLSNRILNNREDAQESVSDTGNAHAQGVLLLKIDGLGILFQPPEVSPAGRNGWSVFRNTNSLSVYGRGAQRMSDDCPASVTHCQRRLAAGRGAQRLQVDRPASVTHCQRRLAAGRGAQRMSDDCRGL